MPIEVTYDGKTSRFVDSGTGGVKSTLRSGRFYEQAFLEHIRSLQLRGVYVDVGAFVGTHTIFFAVHCAAEHVVAFEPRPSEYAELVRNIELNELQHVTTLLRLAAADGPGTIETSFAGTSFQFPATTIDEHVAEAVVVKIDVEGMELAVLQGARELIARSKPMLYVEAATAPELHRVASWLRTVGYRPTGQVFNATPTHEFAPKGYRAVPRDPLLQRLTPRRIAHGLRWRSRRLIRRMRARSQAHPGARG